MSSDYDAEVDAMTSGTSSGSALPPAVAEVAGLFAEAGQAGAGASGPPAGLGAQMADQAGGGGGGSGPPLPWIIGIVVAGIALSVLGFTALRSAAPATDAPPTPPPSAVGTAGPDTPSPTPGRDEPQQPAPTAAGTDGATPTASDPTSPTATATPRETVAVPPSSPPTPSPAAPRPPDEPTTPPNRTPRAQDNAVTTPSGSKVTVNVVANDTDPDGDSLHIAAVTPPGGVRAQVTERHHLTVTVPDDVLGPVAVGYRVCDGRGGCDTATLTVTATNRPPTAADDHVQARTGNPVVVRVLDNDADPEGRLDPGSVEVTVLPATGTATAQSDGTVRVEPEGRRADRVELTYRVCDADGACDEALVTVAWRPPPDTTKRQNHRLDGATTLTIALADERDPSTFEIRMHPEQGALEPLDESSETFTYHAPVNGLEGDDEFVIRVCDDDGAQPGRCYLVTHVVRP